MRDTIYTHIYVLYPFNITREATYHSNTYEGKVNNSSSNGKITQAIPSQ